MSKIATSGAETATSGDGVITGKCMPGLNILQPARRATGNDAPMCYITFTAEKSTN